MAFQTSYAGSPGQQLDGEPLVVHGEGDDPARGAHLRVVGEQRAVVVEGPDRPVAHLDRRAGATGSRLADRRAGGVDPVVGVGRCRDAEEHARGRVAEGARERPAQLRPARGIPAERRRELAQLLGTGEAAAQHPRHEGHRHARQQQDLHEREHERRHVQPPQDVERPHTPTTATAP